MIVLGAREQAQTAYPIALCLVEAQGQQLVITQLAVLNCSIDFGYYLFLRKFSQVSRQCGKKVEKKPWENDFLDATSS